jgi:hypothetical protein
MHRVMADESRVSFIQPMFHFMEKPSPPRFVGG